MIQTAFAILVIFNLYIFVYPQKAVDDGAKYVGYEYVGVVLDTTLPNGVKHLGGGLIGDIEADPVYGIAQVSKGTLRMLWFEVSTGRDSKGVKGWKVMDVLAFPNLAKSDYIFFYGDPSIECLRNGKDVPNLVGVGQINASRGIFKPSKVWTADIHTRRFQTIAMTNLECVYSEP